MSNTKWQNIKKVKDCAVECPPEIYVTTCFEYVENHTGQWRSLEGKSPRDSSFDTSIIDPTTVTGIVLDSSDAITIDMFPF